MVKEAVFAVVGLVVLGVLLALAVRHARLAAQVRRLERDGAELSRTIAAVQGWAAKELRAVRGEFTVSRVNDSAADVLARRPKKSPRPAPMPVVLEDDPEEARVTIAMPEPTPRSGSGPVLEMVPSYDDAPSEDETTHVAQRASGIFDEPPMYAPRPAQRTEAIRPPAPLAYPDLIGCEDMADETARPRLGPDEKTPPRRGRATVLVPTYHAPEEGGS